MTTTTSDFTAEKLGDKAIRISRTFAAPRAKVWRAMTEPALLKRWLFGPPGWAMTVCEDDFREGGHFRWAWEGPGGAKMEMEGTNLEIVPPSRGVRTERFSMGCGPQMGEQHATLELTDRGDTTGMTLTLVYPSAEARDGALASGMEHGMAAGYDRLDEIVGAA